MAERARALMRAHTMSELAPWINVNYRPRGTLWHPVVPTTALADDQFIPDVKKSILLNSVSYDQRFKADKWLHQRALLNYLAAANCHELEEAIYATILDEPTENPYEAIIRAAFQTRIMRITNSRIVNKAHKSGAQTLKKILGRIVHDQRRHEQFYNGLVAKIFEEDPKGAHKVYTLVLESVQV